MLRLSSLLMCAMLVRGALAAETRPCPDDYAAVPQHAADTKALSFTLPISKPRQAAIATQNLVSLLRGTSSDFEVLTGVPVLARFADLVSDPRAITVDATTGAITIDLAQVPEYLIPYVRRIERLVKGATATNVGSVLAEVTRVVDEAAEDPKSPVFALSRKVLADLGDYTAWSDRREIEKSESPSNFDQRRQVFRDDQGRRAVAHTLDARGKVEKREVLAAVEDGAGGYRLVAFTERKGPDGKVERVPDRSCFNCHAISRGGNRITTLKPRTGVMQERSDKLTPLDHGTVVPKF